MDEKEKNSLKVVISFLIPLWLVSNVVEFFLFESGLTRQISGFAMSLSSLLEQDWIEFILDLGTVMFFGVFAIGFLDWGFSKLIGFKQLRSDAWKRALILGFILGLAAPLIGMFSSNAILNFATKLIVIVLIWILFRNYSLTLRESNE